MTHESLRLDVLTYYITFKCNMQCKHCWLNSPQSGYKYMEKMNINILRKALKEISVLNIKRLVITGGEPLLFKDNILEILKLIKELSIPSVSIETNGYFLDKDYAMKLSKYNDILLCGVSLDFANAKNFDLFRGITNAFDKAINAIKILKNMGINTGVMMSVFKDNIDEVPKVAEIAFKELKVDALKFNPIIMMGRAKETLQHKLLDVQSILKFINVTKELIRQYKKVGVALPPALIGYYTSPYFCPYKRMIGLMPNGDVTICASFGFKGYVAGNIFSDNLYDLYASSPLFNKIRALTPNDFKGVCKLCILSPYCAPACPAYALEYYATYYASNPICQMFFEAGYFPKSFLKE